MYFAMFVAFTVTGVLIALAVDADTDDRKHP